MRMQARADCSVACSTPVGVMRSVTRLRQVPRALAAGAQRLSASWIGSRGHAASRVADSVLNACRRHRDRSLCNRPAVDMPWMQCSTPVGVMDRFTSRRLASHVADGVLNACRRHGSVTRCHVASRNDARRCAQRLSASWIGHGPSDRWYTRPRLMCSTPVGVMRSGH